MPSPLQAVASVTPLAPRLPAAKAVWTVDSVAKTSTAQLFGGTATIIRREDTGKFAGEYLLPESKIKLSQTLKTAATLLEAQERMEALVRNSMSKTHPELLAAIEETEAQERIAAAGDDPF